LFHDSSASLAIVSGYIVPNCFKAAAATAATRFLDDSS
jgi:hypothetical protein